MADLNVNVNVNGEEQLDKLDTKLKQVEKSSKDVETSTGGLSNAFKGLANKGAGAVIGALTAIAAAGTDAINKMRELDGNVRRLDVSSKDLTESFSALSATILKQTRLYDGFNAIMEIAGEKLTQLNVALGGNTLGLSENEQKVGELASQIIKLTKIYGEEDETVQKLKKEYDALNKEITTNYEVTVKGISAKDKQLGQQKKIQEELKREQEELDKLNKEYDIASDKADKFVDDIYNKSDAIKQSFEDMEKQIQVTEEYINVTERATEAIRANISALRDQRDAQGVGSASTDASYQQGSLAGNGATGTSSAPTVSGATAYAINSGIVPSGWADNNYSRELKKQTAELKKLNNKVG